jgi:hypothetical protein
VRIAAAGIMALAVAGCTADPPGCHPGMPLSSQLRADPAFSTLVYHSHHARRPLRPIPYDFWADEKFDYAAALQYQLALKSDAKSPDDECTYAISMRFQFPGHDLDRRRLHVFSQAVAPAAGMDAAMLEGQMLEVIRTADKYRPREAIKGKAEISAGRLYHQTRGDFFLMTVTWPKPEGADKARYY